MRVLITGGAGFIGSHLADAYLERGTRSSSSTTSPRAASTISATCAEHPDFSTRSRACTTRRRGRTGRPVRRGLSSGGGGRCETDRREPRADDRNQRARHRGRAGAGQQEEEEGARRVDLGSLRAERPRFLFARTATWCWDQPRRAAGVTPARRPSTSSWLWPTGASCKLPTVIVRLFNTVGPRQTGQYGMVVPTFIKQALTGRADHDLRRRQPIALLHLCQRRRRALVRLMDHPGAGRARSSMSGSSRGGHHRGAGEFGRGADRLRSGDRPNSLRASLWRRLRGHARGGFPTFARSKL